MCNHRKSNLTIPGVPEANFVFNEPSLRSSFSKALFNGESSESHFSKLHYRRIGIGIWEIERKIIRLFQRSSYQQPSLALAGYNDTQASPLITNRASFASSRSKRFPIGARKTSGYFLQRHRSVFRPEGERDAPRFAIRNLSDFHVALNSDNKAKIQVSHPSSATWVHAVNFIADNPAVRTLKIKNGVPNHLRGQLGYVRNCRSARTLVRAQRLLPEIQLSGI